MSVEKDTNFINAIKEKRGQTRDLYHMQANLAKQDEDVIVAVMKIKLTGFLILELQDTSTQIESFFMRYHIVFMENLATYEHLEKGRFC